MIPEAPLGPQDGGLVPRGPGWFVLSTAEARWLTGTFGAYTRFEGEDGQAKFSELGFNIGVLEPGQASCMYHREDAQEDFLVLSGECLLLVEGQERRCKQWDFVHCPPWTNHVFVGAGDGPCTLLAVGTRIRDAVVYPADELAQRHRAGVERDTPDPAQAYRDVPDDVPTAFDPTWLPGG